jgi:hypothetical protein
MRRSYSRLAESVPSLLILVAEGGVANLGRTFREGEYHRHSRVVCRVLQLQVQPKG